MARLVPVSFPAPPADYSEGQPGKTAHAGPDMSQRGLFLFSLDVHSAPLARRLTGVVLCKLLIADANASHASRPKVSTGPSGFLESRTSTAPGTVATSVHSPPPEPL